MPPPPLLADHYYHIYSRGINSGTVFFEERNYRYFLKLYSQHIFPIAKTYAYCLMKNHFHFLVSMRSEAVLPATDHSVFRNPKGLDNTTTPAVDLSGFRNLTGLNSTTHPIHDLSGFKNLKSLNEAKVINYSQHFANLFNAYTKAVNKSYQRSGSLFEKPFHRILIDSDSYFVQLVSYIHRNPQKHGVTTDFRSYPHSSYLTIYDQKHSRIETQTTLGWFGSISSFEAYHLQTDDNAISHLITDD